VARLFPAATASAAAARLWAYPAPERRAESAIDSEPCEIPSMMRQGFAATLTSYDAPSFTMNKIPAFDLKESKFHKNERYQDDSFFISDSFDESWSGVFNRNR
jgi:hypothetical protein